jgi:hypothetical protein
MIFFNFLKDLNQKILKQSLRKKNLIEKDK